MSRNIKGKKRFSVYHKSFSSGTKLHALGVPEPEKSKPTKWIHETHDPILLDLLVQFQQNKITNTEIMAYFKKTFNISATSVTRHTARLRRENPSLKKTEGGTVRQNWTPKMEAELAAFIGQLESGSIARSDIDTWFFEKYNLEKGPISGKMRKVRKKLKTGFVFPDPASFTKQPAKISLAAFVDQDWPLDRVEALVTCIANRFTVDEICNELSISNTDSLRKKINDLIKAKVDALDLKTRKPFTEEETLQLLDMKGEYTNLDIALRLGRSPVAIKTKSSSLLNVKADISQYDWAKFNLQKFLFVPADQWFTPQARTRAFTSVCLLLHPELFKAQDPSVLVKLLREAILIAEQKQTAVRVWLTSGQEDLQNFVDNQHLPGNFQPRAPLTPKFKGLLFATMLGDGTLHKRDRESGKSNYKFIFSQTANLMSQTKVPQSHLEYVISFYNEVDGKNLRPGSFTISRGILLKKLQGDVKHVWFAGVNFSDLEGLSELHSFFYPESKKMGQSNQKTLPSSDIFKYFFANNPHVDFMLCHMYMQDGSKRQRRYNGIYYYTAALYMFTRDENACKRLAYLLWQTTGLKFRVYSENVRDKFTNVMVRQSTLLLALGCVNSFMERIRPSLLPCMEYKWIETVDMDRFSEVIQHNEKIFQEQLESWKQ